MIHSKATQMIVFSMMLFSAQVAHSQRAIAFDGIENARDMGTLVMQDGRTIRSGMLLRSGALNKATDADAALLKDHYRLTDVFDFRYEAEADAAPDRTIDGVSYTHLSTLPQKLIEGFSAGQSGATPAAGKDLAAQLAKFALLTGQGPRWLGLGLRAGRAGRQPPGHRPGLRPLQPELCPPGGGTHSQGAC